MIKRLLALVTITFLLLFLTLNSISYANMNNNNNSSEKNVTNIVHDMKTGQTSYEEMSLENIDYSKGKINNDPSRIITPWDNPSDGRIQITNTTDSPYRNFCRVEATFSDNVVYTASGVLVDFDVVLTAAHVIYRHNNNVGWATSVRVIPGKYGNSEPLGDTYSTNITSNEAYINNIDHNYDWAMIDLQDSFSTFQLYGYYSDYSGLSGTWIEAYGYPNYITPPNVLYKSTSTIVSSTDGLITHICDVTDGQSGGPVLDFMTDYLVGINSYETTYYNYACRINQDLYGRIVAHCQ